MKYKSMKGGNKKMKNIIPVFALLAVIGLLGAAVVSAQGFMEGMTEEEREAMHEAVENGDYESWRAVGERGFSEERFQKMRAHRAEMQERRALMDAAFESGNYEAWREAVSMNGKGQGALDIVTEENFNLFVEMHEARQAGNNDRAEEIRAELGLPERGSGDCDGSGLGGKGKGMGRGRWNR